MEIKTSQCWYDAVSVVDGIPNPTGNPKFLPAPVKVDKVIHEGEGYKIVKAKVDGVEYYLKVTGGELNEDLAKGD